MRALDRALDILDVIAAGGGLTLRRSPAAGPGPSTVHRVLVTLAVRGVAESDHATQTWHVGPTAFRHGSAFMRRSGLVERARPMRRLMEVTGETANLGILDGNAVLFLNQAETHETIRAFPAGHALAAACLGDRQGAAGAYAQLRSAPVDARDAAFAVHADDAERAAGLTAIWH